MKKENILAININFGLKKTTKVLAVAILALALGLLFNLDKTAFGQYGGGGGSVGITPSNTSISINDGDASTASPDVTLTLGATNALTMAISNNASFTGASYETYNITKEWALTSGDGEKTVYAKFRNTSDSPVVSDTIILDEDSSGDDVSGEREKEREREREMAGLCSDDELLKSSDSPHVYVCRNNTKHHIRSVEEFDNAGYKWGNIKVVSAETLQQIKSSVALIRAAGDPKVYIVENGKRRHIASAAAFNAAGYNWGDIQVISQTEVNAYTEEGGVILIRVAGDVKVYVVENGKRRHIASAAAFNAAGYNWEDIREVSAEEANSYADETASSIIVDSPWLRIRASNNTGSGILGLVYNGETYNILEKLDGWYKIESKVGIGWVSGNYVKEQ